MAKASICGNNGGTGISPKEAKDRIMLMPRHAHRRVCTIIWWDYIDLWANPVGKKKKPVDRRNRSLCWIVNHKDLYLEKDDYIPISDLRKLLIEFGYSEANAEKRCKSNDKAVMRRFKREWMSEHAEGDTDEL